MAKGETTYVVFWRLLKDDEWTRFPHSLTVPARTHKKTARAKAFDMVAGGTTVTDMKLILVPEEHAQEAHARLETPDPRLVIE